MSADQKKFIENHKIVNIITNLVRQPDDSKNLIDDYMATSERIDRYKSEKISLLTN